MLQIAGVTVIHIIWEGPFSTADVVKRNLENDYGLYQIYGTHAIFGADTLLRIGQANAGIFAGRLPWYQAEWEPWEPDSYTVYLGRLGGWEPITNDRWGVLIDNAEAITIFKTAPPYNSSRIMHLNVNEPTIVMNHRKRHRLPSCLTNLDELIDIEDRSFKLYGPPGHPIVPPEAAEHEKDPSS